MLITRIRVLIELSKVAARPVSCHGKAGDGQPQANVALELSRRSLRVTLAAVNSLMSRRRWLSQRHR